MTLFSRDQRSSELLVNGFTLHDESSTILTSCDTDTWDRLCNLKHTQTERLKTWDVNQCKMERPEELTLICSLDTAQLIPVSCALDRKFCVLWLDDIACAGYTQPVVRIHQAEPQKISQRNRNRKSRQ
eukprot:4036298-Amphidinium_carterae.1